LVLSYEAVYAKSIANAEGILLAAAGATTATLEVKGRATHADATPELGRNALIELSHQIPEKAFAFRDVRLSQLGAAEELRAALESKIMESHLVPGTEVSIKIDAGRPPYLAGERGLVLAQRAQPFMLNSTGGRSCCTPAPVPVPMQVTRGVLANPWSWRAWDWRDMATTPKMSTSRLTPLFRASI